MRYRWKKDHALSRIRFARLQAILQCAEFLILVRRHALPERGVDRPELFVDAGSHRGFQGTVQILLQEGLDLHDDLLFSGVCHVFLLS